VICPSCASRHLWVISFNDIGRSVCLDCGAHHHDVDLSRRPSSGCPACAQTNRGIDEVVECQGVMARRCTVCGSRWHQGASGAIHSLVQEPLAAR
jgi:hypothetical protein